MKIQAVKTAPPVEPPSSQKQRATAKEQAGEQVSVQLSSDARWLSDVKAEASQTDELMPEEVARAQHDIAQGELEQALDWEEVLDAILMEL